MAQVSARGANVYLTTNYGGEWILYTDSHGRALQLVDAINEVLADIVMDLQKAEEEHGPVQSDRGIPPEIRIAQIAKTFTIVNRD